MRELATFGPLDGVLVLLVDDHLAVREVMTRLLESYGARVTAVPSVADALDSFDRELPDVILSELEMAGANGYALIRNVRARPPDRGGLTPAVAVTTLTGAGDVARALRAGFQRHVAKPIEAGQMVTAVQALASVAGRPRGRRSPRRAGEGRSPARLLTAAADLPREGVMDPGGALRGDGPAGRPEAEPTTPTRPPGGGARRILVVDDEPDVRELVVEVLRSADYEVDTAGDGAGALDLLARQPYDVVVSDLSMPGLDGRGLYREMRRRFPVPPHVVFVTGESSNGAYSEFLAEVEAPVLSKPFHVHSIVPIVRRVLGEA